MTTINGLSATASSTQVAASPPTTRKHTGRKVGIIFAVTWLGCVVVAALTASLLPLPAPDAISGNYSLRPFVDWSSPLGTDTLGRDLLSRALHGAQVSLAVAIGATTAAVVTGTAIGILAGYVRGTTDSILEVATNSILAFPPLIFLIAIVAMLSPGIVTLVVGLALIALPSFARVARASTLSMADREFVLAAHTLGASRLRIMVRELLPNVFRPILSYALVIAATLIVAEGSLSFLGLGVPPPAASWGGMIADARQQFGDHPHLVLVPATFFFFTVLSLNHIGDWANAKTGKDSVL